MTEEEPLTILLNRAARGDRKASELALPEVYESLRRIASARLSRARQGESLVTTALVHEAYLKISRPRSEEPLSLAGRGQFFQHAARAMRDILVDRARERGSLKRGGDLKRVTLHEVGQFLDTPAEDILQLDEILRKLETHDDLGYRIVMLRYFSGLTEEETAEVLEISRTSVQRRWRLCRAWLARELTRESEA